MEPTGKKGTFVGYSESSKAYQIHILGQRYIEVSRDVTFHEEDAFCQCKELPNDTNMEEQEVPTTKILDPESPHPYVQREETKSLQFHFIL